MKQNALVTERVFKHKCSVLLHIGRRDKPLQLSITNEGYSWPTQANLGLTGTPDLAAMAPMLARSRARLMAFGSTLVLAKLMSFSELPKAAPAIPASFSEVQKPALGKLMSF